MVRGSDKTYGEHMLKAREQTDRFEMGELQPYIEERVKNIIEKAVQKQAEAGKFYPKYYVWLRFRKEPYTSNAIHIYPQCRITRPSPYQDPNHSLWMVEHMNKITPQWSVMDRGMREYVLKNPNQFDKHTVQQAIDYKKDRLEKIEDYLVDGKIQ
jgi:hypothetical protein